MFETVTRIHSPLHRCACGFACVAAMSLLMSCASPQPTAEKNPPPLSPTESKATALDKDAEKFAANLSRAQSQTPPPPTGKAPTMPSPEVQWTNAAPKTTPVIASPPIVPPKTDTPPATAALPAVQDRPAELTAIELTRNLSERLKHDSHVGQLRPYLARAALTLADPHRELTESDVPELPPEDRKLVLAYQRAFSELARTLNGDATQNRQQLLMAVEELNEQVGSNRQMSIRTAKLCTKVSGYGVYTTFEKNTFVAGREQPIIVYAEIDRFGAKLDEEGQNVVQLTQQIVLYNESDGLAVWKVKPTEIVDRSRNRRRDFFVVQIVNLPARLTVGKYNLKLTLTDNVSQTVDEATIPIQIVADSDLASKP